MMREDRRQGEDRRDWLERFKRINSVLKHIETIGRRNIDLDSLAETLNLPMTVINRIFSELKNDYAHRFPWLRDDDSIEDIMIPDRNKKQTRR
jgi:hypothetical protein